jgi:hypothetical protein
MHAARYRTGKDDSDVIHRGLGNSLSPFPFHQILDACPLQHTLDGLLDLDPRIPYRAAITHRTLVGLGRAMRGGQRSGEALEEVLECDARGRFRQNIPAMLAVDRLNQARRSQGVENVLQVLWRNPLLLANFAYRNGTVRVGRGQLHHGPGAIAKCSGKLHSDARSQSFCAARSGRVTLIMSEY